MADYDKIYNEEYTKYLGNTVNDIKNAQATAEKGLKTAYDASKKKLDDSRAKALNEAYVTKMLALRDAPAQMAKQGLSGGYTESNLASIERAYANNRNNTQNSYNDNISQLDVGYNNDLSTLKNSYLDMINSAKQNAASQALNSAAQRYNALQAEEAAAAASSGGGSGGGSVSVANETAATPQKSYQTNLSYGTFRGDSVYNNKKKQTSKLYDESKAASRKSMYF